MKTTPHKAIIAPSQNQPNKGLELLTIHNADIIWKGSTPFSNLYDDVYFNTIDGIEESRHVFLKPNRINSKDNIFDNTIVIAETGFGSGLNFFLTLQTWSTTKPSNKWLHYISAEKHPIISADYHLILDILKHQLPQHLPVENHYLNTPQGFKKIVFPKLNTTLTLLIGDATKCYSLLHSQVDIWFLDGFSPSKNPDMWNPELFREIARLSKPGTSFSTFTSASKVRKGLEAVGFRVRKQPGFGKKREMSLGTFIENKVPTIEKKPWFSIPKTEQPTHTTIIGGGLAGCSTAYALAQRGIQVTIIDKASTLASGGSGNRQGALYAKLPITPTKQGELHLTGFLHSVNFLKQIDPKQSFWSQCGVAQLATTDKEDKKQQALISNGHYPDELVLHKSAAELSSIAGSEIRHNGLFFPTAGWVSPVEFCKSLTSHPNINIVQDQISSIEYSDNQWLLSNTSGEHHHCTHLILCNAELANQFTETSHLPLKTIRGQVSITQREAQLTELKTVVCGDGYISPSLHNQFCFGATFDLKGKTLDVTDTDHQKNLVKLSNALPNFHQELISSNTALDGRTAYRCSTPDYMPVVGPTPIYNNYVDQYAKLRKDKNWRFESSAPQHHPNLFINTGHGSKGLITCPISAELLASMICNEPLPLPKDLIDAINPSRFIIKNLIKQAI